MGTMFTMTPDAEGSNFSVQKLRQILDILSSFFQDGWNSQAVDGSWKF